MRRLLCRSAFLLAVAGLLPATAAAQITLVPSAARTASGTQAVTIPAPNLYDSAVFLLSVTAAATEVGDTLDVYLQHSPDGGTTWDDFAHFTQVLGTGPTDDVRLLIGDTDPNASEDARLENEDIARLITLNGNLRYAAAGAARALAAKFARKFEGSSGGPGPSRTRAQDLMAIAGRLEAAGAAAAVPFAGGLRLSEKTTAAADTDRVQPSFSRGMLDHPETG